MIVSRPVTREYAEGWERTFGRPKTAPELERPRRPREPGEAAPAPEWDDDRHEGPDEP